MVGPRRRRARGVTRISAVRRYSQTCFLRPLSVVGQAIEGPAERATLRRREAIAHANLGQNDFGMKRLAFNLAPEAVHVTAERRPPARRAGEPRILEQALVGDNCSGVAREI